ARFNVTCKSPLTSTLDLENMTGTTISYASCGGFFQTKLRLAGYDSLIFTGKSENPVVVVIDNGKVEFRDGRKYWGMLQYDCEKQLLEDLGEPGYEVASIGPAAENGVRYCSVLHTMGRAAGRGGVGTVMGSKNLKAVAVRGDRLPEVADHKLFLEQLARLREANVGSTPSRYGTAASLVTSSDRGNQVTRNFREGTDLEAVTISGVYAENGVWTRDIACYCCPQACKKIGVGRGGKWGKWVVEGPEYETGTMLGTNLLIHDMNGMMKLIGECDDYGFDQISVGNVIGFLMECYEKGVIDRKFLGGIDLKWGDVQATRDVMRKIAYREDDVGQLAALGVKRLSEYLGKGTEAYAIQSKGQEYAAHRRATSPEGALGYITSNRGGCHMNSGSASGHNSGTLNNSLVICSFGGRGGFREVSIPEILSAITGEDWDQDKYALTGERIFNLEKCFNYREGFRREDDEWVPARFYTEPLTVGPAMGVTWDPQTVAQALDRVYTDHGWDVKTSKPSEAKLTQLGLDYAWKEIANL
ncbi:aldehyde ferredoxin oxidoreductase family protein, partial [Candidatus Latescibacterota bacterium]